MKKVLRFLRKLLFWCFFTGLFLLTAITVILHVYEDDIKRFAIEEINSYLKTDIEVRNIELSVFHDFPSASLEFDHVLIGDAFEEQAGNDTLLFSTRIFCSFSLWDIWNGDYKVNRVSAEDSWLNLRTAKNGDVNYNILKETEEDTTGSNFRFILDLLRIDRLRLRYINLATAQFYDIDIRKALLRGDFSESEYDIVAESDLFIRRIKSNALSLINYKPARLNLELGVNTNEKSYVFRKGDLKIGHMPFDITGRIDSVEMDLEIKGKDIELAQLANSISAGMETARKYNGTGIIDFTSSIEGPVSSTGMPSITAAFEVMDGTLTEPVNKLKIYDIRLKGEYRNAQKGREELLSFEEVNLRLLDSYFSGSGSVRNFAQPLIDARMKGNLELSAFHRFFHFRGVEKLAGDVDLDLDLSVAFPDPQYRAEQFSVYRSTGNLSLKDVLYKAAGGSQVYQDINGDIAVNNNDAAVRGLSIKTGKSDLLFNGAMNNIMQYITGTGSLGMIVSLESSHIDLNEFIGESNSNEEAPPTRFELPGDLNLNIELDVKDLLWDEHRFTGIGGKLLLSNRKATVSGFSMKTLGGDIRGNLVLNNLLDGGNIVESQITFRGVDVRTLFAEWKNFDQETITDQNISGTGNGSIDLLLFFNPYFSIIEEKIYALADIEIVDGELKNVETMKLVTDYMRSNKALKLMLNKHIDQFEEKLTHIRFAHLSNRIEIRDRKIIIPKMKISNNALDLELFGWHDFDNNVEYHFSFRFRDLKTIPEYTEFGKIEDDGLGLIIYLTMSGSLDDPQFALDKDERKNDIKESITEEKQLVKSMLKSEFGLFRNDSTVQQLNRENKSQAEFIFYDEDIEETDTVRKDRNKVRTGKFFEKILQETSKEEKVEFKEDGDQD